MRAKAKIVELDCDVLADAVRGCAANMIERMREGYHRYDPQCADEVVRFIRDQLGGDAEYIFDEALATADAWSAADGKEA